MVDQRVARLPMPVLAGLLAAGLWWGGTWWADSAPATGNAAATSPASNSAAATSGAGTSGAAATGAAAGSRTAADLVVPGPMPGEEPPRPRTPRRYQLRPDTPVVAQAFAVVGDPAIAPDPAELSIALPPGTLDWLLPPAADAVLQGDVLLGRGATLLVEGPGAVGSYRWEVACTGASHLQLEATTGSGLPDVSRIQCGSEPASVEIDLIPGYAGVRLTHPAGSDSGDQTSPLLAVRYQLLRQ